uniref:Uncharacterized protein n=1 Tax=Anguilla anguilla TaxID=7936 RepID=A0A0E9V7X4_ANGAN
MKSVWCTSMEEGTDLDMVSKVCVFTVKLFLKAGTQTSENINMHKSYFLSFLQFSFSKRCSDCAIGLHR